MSPDSKPLLLEVMEQACFGCENWQLEIAAEIEALRDWLPDMPPEELIEQWCNEPAASMASMTARTMEWLRTTLTEQAQLAKEC